MGSDDQALHDFVTGRYADLRRSAFLMGGDWSAADELTRDVLARVVADVRGGDVDDPEAYAYAELMRSFRHRPPRREHLFVAPETAVGDQTRTVLICAALHRLSPLCRAVLVLRHWAGFGPGETADVLGLTDQRVAAYEADGLAILAETRLDPVPVP